MLILFESAVGYCLFKVLDETKLQNVDNIYKEFMTKEKRDAFIQLKKFKAFKNTDDAVEAVKCVEQGEQLHKTLRKFIKKNVVQSDEADTLGLIDTKIGGLLKDKFDSLQITSNDSIFEVTRGLREHFVELLGELTPTQTEIAQLGLSHALSRHKLKFSAEKVDTMIIQAVALLDELDKEINIYAMRVKEWYGWHFPEMTKICVDNMQYCRVVIQGGLRKTYALKQFDDITDEHTEARLKNMAKISMGSAITDSDLDNIQSLAQQVIDLTEYRNELYQYLRNRMLAIAPNLTMMVGELVGARLLAHAGSLISLAKYPASTVQILGAEKALFRALKAKSATPKYGLIYHASFVNAASQGNKAKIARTLACKTSLCARIDAFTEVSRAIKPESKDDDGDDDEKKGDDGDDDDIDISKEIITDTAAKFYNKMEQRLENVEGRKVQVQSKSLAGQLKPKHSFVESKEQFDDSGDIVMKKEKKKDKRGKKRKKTDDDDDRESVEPPKKKRKIEVESKDDDDDDDDVDIGDDDDDQESSKKKKKKKKKKSKEESTEMDDEEEEPKKERKKKKKKKKKE